MTATARWAAAWGGAAALGMANGVARDLLYRDRLGDLRAHQVSTATLIAALAAYAAALERRHPIPTASEARTIGAIWSGLTVAFEFVLGRRVTHESWASLLGNYDLRRGRVWSLVPLALATLPVAVQRAERGR